MNMYDPNDYRLAGVTMLPASPADAPECRRVAVRFHDVDDAVIVELAPYGMVRALCEGDLSAGSLRWLLNMLTPAPTVTLNAHGENVQGPFDPQWLQSVGVTYPNHLLNLRPDVLAALMALRVMAAEMGVVTA